jgi:hypothetical protein
MEGGFFLRKKPLCCMDFVNTRIENAVVVGKAMKNCKKTIRDCR